MGNNDDILKAIRQGNDEAKARHEEMTRKLDAINKKLDTLDSRVKDIEVRTQQVDEKVDKIKSELNVLQQKELKHNFIVKGVPESEGESPEHLISVVQAVVSHLKVDVQDSITSVKRFGRQIETKQWPLLVEVNDPDIKHDIISKKRQVQIGLDSIILNDVPLGANNYYIYIDEHLTPLNSDLYKQARELKKRGMVKYAWTKNGTVCIKQADNTRAILLGIN